MHLHRNVSAHDIAHVLAVQGLHAVSSMIHSWRTSPGAVKLSILKFALNSKSTVATHTEGDPPRLVDAGK
jgi:hypothetical protein